MADNLIPSGTLTSDLLDKIEYAAVSAARDVLTGRKILDVKGPLRTCIDQRGGWQ